MNFLVKAVSRVALNPAKDVLLRSPLNKNLLLSKRWGHNAELTYDFAREKIMLVLHLFDKIDPNKLTLDSHFITDLGLDSLDHVEIIMHLEDEFGFEIPDKDAEKLLRPKDILRYITDKEEAYEELQTLSHHHDHDHGHNHETSSHGHNSVANGNHDQKRHFSSWSMVAKRFLSDDVEIKEYYPTTFSQKPYEAPNLNLIQERVMKVCSKYDKIDSSKLDLTSHFVTDLGLDSLDHVEILMELEDEFGYEIPDQDAEKLMRPIEVARYIFEKEDKPPTTEERPF